MSGPACKERMGNRKGMTMAEVLACLSIMAFLMLAVLSVMTSSARMFHNIADSARARRMTESLGDLIREQLVYAKTLELDGSGGAILEDTGQIIFTEDGRVIWNGEMLYGEKFYADYRFFCNVHLPEENDDSAVLELTLFLENDRKEPFYSFRTVIKLVNLNLHDREGISVDGGLTKDGDLDSHYQEICFRFQNPGKEYRQNE